MSETRPAPIPALRPRRAITGMSAVLLAWRDGTPDFAAFEHHLDRTLEAGLIPAVNMDTGYVNLLDPATRSEVLDCTRQHTDRAVAGAHLGDHPGAPLDLDGYRRQVEAITSRGFTPVIFPSHGLCDQGGEAWVGAHETLARDADEMIAFELSPAFLPCGRIFDLGTYESLLGISAVIGAKHSSLHRQPEFDRLALRDALRPDFLVLTGNDLAIDMVQWGSDYLLGLSSFAPDLFAERDRRWSTGDASFYELNDVLQYLGQVAFRPPVPAYKHACAMFLQLRGWLETDETPAEALRRPDADWELLADIADRLGVRA